MVRGTLPGRIHGVIGLMIIYGNSGQDIRRMIWRRKYKLLIISLVILVAMMLTGCGTAKPKNTMTEFWKAIVSGEISPLKTIKGAEEKEDGSWDSMEEEPLKKSKDE